VQVKKHVNVVGAVILRDGEVLCAQRGPASSLAGKWEFPGGKIEPGETPREALEREILEELRCTVRVGEEVITTTHEYDFAIVKLTTFYCELVEGSPQLTEHAAVAWFLPDHLESLDWAPADVPAVGLIRQALS
jgi:8-oxo-dGTP diphosphatase